MNVCLYHPLTRFIFWYSTACVNECPVVVANVATIPEINKGIIIPIIIPIKEHLLFSVDSITNKRLMALQKWYHRKQLHSMRRTLLIRGERKHLLLTMQTTTLCFSWMSAWLQTWGHSPEAIIWDKGQCPRSVFYSYAYFGYVIL